MPPNAKGGKGYKKGKHTTQDDKLPEWDTAKGQMLGRVIRKLGNRRFRVFCNDNKQRHCKLCGSMRKSEWVDEGAIVILSLRELSNGSSSVLKGSEEEVGDILMTIDRSLYSKLKKLPGVNPLLFGNVEQQDEAEMKKKIEAQQRGEKIEDDVFDDESEDEEEEDGSEDSDEGLTGEEKAKKKQLGREAKEKKRAQAISAARAKKEDKDIDDKFIDEI